MFIAMNRFKIIPGKENEFEKIWKDRDTHLNNVPGFKKFNLVKGEKMKNSLYMLLTVYGTQKMIL